MVDLKLKRSVKILIMILIFIALIFITAISIYLFLLRPCDKKSKAIIVVNIERGNSTHYIAKELKKKNLIRNELVFKFEVLLNKKSIKASSYELSKNMSTKEIVNVITEGNIYNPNNIRITFKEGETIKKYALEIANNTNNSYEQVLNTINNVDYLNQLIVKYWFLTTEILNNDIYVPLEGYLSPNTYDFKDKNVKVEEIIETMLNQTEKELNYYKEIIDNSNMSVHQYLTIASMLELEGIKLEDRQMIAGVFNNRLNRGMNLGSDVTTYYALQKEMDKDLTVGQFATENPYNTRASNMGGKLPVGPICNSSNSSIKASIYPTNNDYLFFVADKNGKIYYTKTNEEHLMKVKEIKESGEWIW